MFDFILDSGHQWPSICPVVRMDDARRVLKDTFGYDG